MKIGTNIRDGPAAPHVGFCADGSHPMKIDLLRGSSLNWSWQFKAFIDMFEPRVHWTHQPEQVF